MHGTHYSRWFCNPKIRISKKIKILFQVYPLMLTERNSLRQGRDVSDSKFVPASLLNERRNSAARAPSSPSKMSSCCRRTRSFSLDINDEINVVRGRHRIAMSSAASAIPPVRHFGLSYSSSVDISTTTVPEDTELNCTNPGKPIKNI